MPKMTIQSEKCIACWKCYLNFPEVFDCDDSGIAFTIPESTLEQHAQSMRAIYECPTKAIQLEEKP